MELGENASPFFVYIDKIKIEPVKAASQAIRVARGKVVSALSFKKQSAAHSFIKVSGIAFTANPVKNPSDRVPHHEMQ